VISAVSQATERVPVPSGNAIGGPISMYLVGGGRVPTRLTQE
jgi:hypothetical protein